ncbi:MAG: hypothetical protein HRT44_12195, partial [Bdellovibrionales bacterium]|nr:hypothetical protein [Bdellovibrionales bacterium]
SLTNHPDDFYLKYSGIKSGHDQENPVTQQGFEHLPSFEGFDLDDDDIDDDE